MGDGIEFFYDMPILEFLGFLRDYNDVISEENEKIENIRRTKKGRR